MHRHACRSEVVIHTMRCSLPISSCSATRHLTTLVPKTKPPSLSSNPRQGVTNPIDGDQKLVDIYTADSTVDLQKYVE